MTTDTRAKTAFAKMKRRDAMAGMTKGSGMIQPRMATTLGFVMTDAVASPAELRAALKHAIGVSLQPHLGGRRHLDQRHGGRAGQRRIGSQAGSARRSRRR